MGSVGIRSFKLCVRSETSSFPPSYSSISGRRHVRRGRDQLHATPAYDTNRRFVCCLPQHEACRSASVHSSHDMKIMLYLLPLAQDGLKPSVVGFSRNNGFGNTVTLLLPSSFEPTACKIEPRYLEHVSPADHLRIARPRRFGLEEQIPRQVAL